MRGYIDLHCHWLVGVDDGARTLEEARAMLAGLRQLGFGEVVATPHIRPQMFENSAVQLRGVFEEQAALHREPKGPQPGTPQQVGTAAGNEAAAAALAIPTLSLGAEHFFVDSVHQLIVTGEALPYRGGKAVLVELAGEQLPQRFESTLAALRRGGLVPVIAHPERYRALWDAPDRLESWLDAGAAALLDVGALVGKYGSLARDSAVLFLERGYYSAACSDAHRFPDIEITKQAMAWLTRKHGEQETHSLFHDGPRSILEGTVTA